MTAPQGWDPGTYTPPPCPVCGTPVDTEWIDVTPMGSVTAEWVPGRPICPTSRFHNVDAAAELVTLVGIVHAEHGSGWVPLTELDTWRAKGWRPLDPELQMAAEMVEQRIVDLARE